MDRGRDRGRSRSRGRDPSSRPLRRPRYVTSRSRSPSRQRTSQSSVADAARAFLESVGVTPEQLMTGSPGAREVSRSAESEDVRGRGQRQGRDRPREAPRRSEHAEWVSPEPVRRDTRRADRDGSQASGRHAEDEWGRAEPARDQRVAQPKREEPPARDRRGAQPKREVPRDGVKREPGEPSTRGLSAGPAGKYGVRTVSGSGAVRVETEGVGIESSHNVHLAEVRHWKWCDRQGRRQELIKAPAHPFVGGLPMVHLLWQLDKGKKSGKGYKLIDHPSMRCGSHMHGYEPPTPDDDEDGPKDDDDGRQGGRNAPGLKGEQRDVKLGSRRDLVA